MSIPPPTPGCFTRRLRTPVMQRTRQPLLVPANRRHTCACADEALRSETTGGPQARCRCVAGALGTIALLVHDNYRPNRRPRAGENRPPVVDLGVVGRVHPGRFRAGAGLSRAGVHLRIALRTAVLCSSGCAPSLKAGSGWRHVTERPSFKKPIRLLCYDNPLAIAGKTHRPFQIGAVPPRRADLRFPRLLHPRGQVAVAVVLLRKDHGLLRPDGLQ